MNTISLLTLFEQRESELRTQLMGIVLPRDNERLNNVLADLFVNHIGINDYKQELTDSELAIFQSALRLVEDNMQLHQAIFTSSDLLGQETQEKVSQKSTKNHSRFHVNKSQAAILSAAATGILVGAVTNVGTILLAIVTAATGVWLSTEKANEHFSVKEQVSIKQSVVDVDAIISNTKRICASLDNLMSAYHTNVDNLSKRIENRPSPTLANTYGYLLNRLATLYRDMSNNAAQEDIIEDIEKLYKTLKNYNYEFVSYSDDNKRYFDVEEIMGITEPEENEVAILEKGECISRGKYYKPKE